MEGGPFDDNLFPDFSGCAAGTSTLLSAKAHADSRGNVHSIQVMLGLQHSDLMLGGKMDAACHMGAQHHDMAPLFTQPTDQHLASTTPANSKRKSEEGAVSTNLQHQGEQRISISFAITAVFLKTYSVSTTKKLWCTLSAF